LIICTFFDFASLAWKRLFPLQNWFLGVDHWGLGREYPPPQAGGVWGRGMAPSPENFSIWVWKWRLLVHSGCLPTRRGRPWPLPPPLDPPVADWRPKSITIAITSLKGSRKGRIDHTHPYLYPENLVKIVPVHSEIIGLQGGH